MGDGRLREVVAHGGSTVYIKMLRKHHKCKQGHKAINFDVSFLTPKAWFSLAQKHKHKDIRSRRMSYLTQFSIPALLNRV